MKETCKMTEKKYIELCDKMQEKIDHHENNLQNIQGDSDLEMCRCDNCENKDKIWITFYDRNERTYFNVGIWGDGRAYFGDILEERELPDSCHNYFKDVFAEEDEKEKEENKINTWNGLW
jgi:hypothetical protein